MSTQLPATQYIGQDGMVLSESELAPDLSNVATVIKAVVVDVGSEDVRQRRITPEMVQALERELIEWPPYEHLQPDLVKAAFLAIIRKMNQS